MFDLSFPFLGNVRAITEDENERIIIGDKDGNLRIVQMLPDKFVLTQKAFKVLDNSVFVISPMKNNRYCWQTNRAPAME